MSGMSERLMAASWTFVTRNAPRIPALSSPMRPLDRLTMRILPSSIILRMSKEDLGWPMILRIIGLAVKAPTLFKTGAIDSLTCLSFHWPNSCFQNWSTVTSLQ